MDGSDVIQWWKISDQIVWAWTSEGLKRFFLYQIITIWGIEPHAKEDYLTCRWVTRGET